MKSTHALGAALALVCLLCGRLSAAEKTWWNSSFGGTSTKVTPAKGTGQAPVITKVSNSTKRLVSGTKNMFVKKPTVTKRSGTTAVISRTPKSEKPGFFKSLWNPEPPPPPKTVKEWMQLKQIHP